MTPKKIGDPLEQVATTGKIGGRISSPLEVQQVESLKTQPSGLPNGQSVGTLATQTAGASKGQNAKGSRVQQTVYLPPDLAKWVKIQAIEEGREISEIAADALELYRQSH